MLKLRSAKIEAMASHTTTASSRLFRGVRTSRLGNMRSIVACCPCSGQRGSSPRVFHSSVVQVRCEPERCQSDSNAYSRQDRGQTRAEPMRGVIGGARAIDEGSDDLRKVRT